MVILGGLTYGSDVLYINDGIYCMINFHSFCISGLFCMDFL